MYSGKARFIDKFKLDHVAFWLAMFLSLYDETEEGDGWAGYLGMTLWTFMLLNMLSVYLNFYVIVPRWLHRQRFVAFGFIFLAHVSFFTFLFWRVYVDMLQVKSLEGEALVYFLRNMFIGFLFTNSIALILRFLKHRIVSEQRFKEEERERIRAELNYLRAQINPHFLFNGINSIYHLIDMDGEKAKGTLLRFSELLRYQLYECNDGYVMLEQELNYLRNYIALEQLRKDDDLTIRFESHCESEELRLAPMIFISFIENAFKHASQSGGYISIILHEADGVIQLEVENSIGKSIELPLEGRVSGLGLDNVKRRLDLLYPNAYKLSIDKTEAVFKLELQLFTTKGNV